TTSIRFADIPVIPGACAPAFLGTINIRQFRVSRLLIFVGVPLAILHKHRQAKNSYSSPPRNPPLVFQRIQAWEARNASHANAGGIAKLQKQTTSLKPKATPRRLSIFHKA